MRGGDDQGGDLRLAHHPFRHGTNQDAGNHAVPVGTHHHQALLGTFGLLEDRLQGIALQQLRFHPEFGHFPTLLRKGLSGPHPRLLLKGVNWRDTPRG